MTFEIILTLGIILTAIVLFVRETFTIDTVSILVMVVFMVSGILTPSEGFSGFNNPATLTVGAMFVLSAAIFKSGALNSVTTILKKAAGVNYFLMLLLMMGIAGSLSAFINDTAVVALFMPVVIKLGKDTGINPSRLLMPLSFGALLGGVCTLVGTSTNILVSGIAEEYGEEPFGMFELTGAGIWFFGAGLLYMVVVGSRLLPDRKLSKDLGDSYEMKDYITEIKILPNSPSAGKRISESKLIKDIDLEILSIIRGGKGFEPNAYTILELGDFLRVRCDVEKLSKLEQVVGIELQPSKAVITEDEAKQEIKLIEVLVNPNAIYIGKSLSDMKFRMLFNGASVLAMRSRSGVLHEKFKDIKLKAGDILLVRANTEQSNLINRNKNLLIISEVEDVKPRYRQMIPTLLIMVGVIAVAALNILPIVLTAAIGGLLLIAFKFLTPEEAYQAIDWKVIFMLAGVLSMGTALQKTGAAELLASFMIDTLGQFGPRAMVSGFFFLSFMATNVMSNNASAALLAPVALVTAEVMGISSRPFLMAVTFAASLSFMTPMGYQTNAMIYGPGNYRFSDYLKVGTPLNIILWILASIIIPLYFPI